MRYDGGNNFVKKLKSRQLLNAKEFHLPFAMTPQRPDGAASNSADNDAADIVTGVEQRNLA